LGPWIKDQILAKRVDKILVFSDDGGQTWRLMARTHPTQRLPEGTHGVLPAAGHPLALNFVAPFTGFLALSGGEHPLWMTVDAGVTWAPAGSGMTSADVWAMEFSDPMHGRVRLSDWSVWLTEDGGLTWAEVASRPILGLDPCDDLSMVPGVEFRLDDTHWWRVCQMSQRYTCNQDTHALLFSSDMGSTWSVLFKSLYAAAVSDLIFTTVSDGWLGSGGSCGNLQRTSDGGRTWEHVREVEVSGGGVNLLEFSDALRGRVTGMGRTWITEDGGDTWIELPPTPTPAAR
jgi:photosystem II stability/assembly factor-like uncharacterized protein